MLSNSSPDNAIRLALHIMSKNGIHIPDTFHVGKILKRAIEDAGIKQADITKALTESELNGTHNMTYRFFKDPQARTDKIYIISKAFNIDLFEALSAHLELAQDQRAIENSTYGYQRYKKLYEDQLEANKILQDRLGNLLEKAELQAKLLAMHESTGNQAK